MKALYLTLTLLTTQTAYPSETTVLVVPQAEGGAVSYMWDSGVGVIGGLNTHQTTNNEYSYDTWTMDSETGKPTNLTATSGYKVEWEAYAGPVFKTTEQLQLYGALSLVKTNEGCTTAKKDGVIYYQDCRSPVDPGLILGAMYNVPSTPLVLDVRYSSTYAEFQAGFGLRF